MHLNNLNMFTPYQYLKTEYFDFIKEKDYMYKVDLKDVYVWFLYHICKKYALFQWMGYLYDCPCLCFWLRLVYRLFTWCIKIPVVFLRSITIKNHFLLCQHAFNELDNRGSEDFRRQIDFSFKANGISRWPKEIFAVSNSKL